MVLYFLTLRFVSTNSCRQCFHLRCDYARTRVSVYHMHKKSGIYERTDARSVPNHIFNLL